MVVLDTIRPLLDTVLGEVQANRDHEMDPQRRREVYDALRGLAGEEAVGWLAVVTARRVLPVFQQRYPEDTLPHELLETAVGVLRGQVDDARAEEMLDCGYHASGSAWGYDEREIPWPVWLAGNASYHALKEVRGRQPLSTLPEHCRDGTPTPWSDQDLCQFAFGDTAAVAAVASASNAHGTACDPQRLLAYWRWWLAEAIPAAVEAAASNEAPW